MFFEGWNIKAPVYKHLGEYESTDTIDGTNLLLDKYPYLDRENVAIFGWVGKCVISTLIFVESLAFLFSDSPVTHSYEIYLFFLLRPALS